MQCKSCRAGFGQLTSPVRYKPKDATVHRNKVHPEQLLVEQEKKEKKKEEQNIKRQKKASSNSQRVKAGLKKEEQVRKRVNALVSTLKSGAIFGDGDYKVLGELQADHKYRIVRKSFTLSRKEYEDGRRQGTDHWLITVTGENRKDETVVIMTLEGYARLLALATQHKEQDNSKQPPV